MTKEENKPERGSLEIRVFDKDGKKKDYFKRTRVRGEGVKVERKEKEGDE